jgi:hypothetical protein
VLLSLELEIELHVILYNGEYGCRPPWRQEGNRMDLKGTGCEHVNWSRVAQDITVMDLLNTAMNLTVK